MNSNTPVPTVDNPFQAIDEAAAGTTAVEQERAAQEIQAAMVIAQKFPRQQRVVMDRILQSCTRVGLADKAMYVFPRGTSSVTGPSIRLAEAIAQEWGNMHFGVQELNSTPFETSVQAFAWDLERNVKQVKTFTVKNVRFTRQGSKQLEDPRDLYENVANQAARRLRACILGIIPGDVIEAAITQCQLTLQNSIGAPVEEVEKIVEAFVQFGVTKEMIAKRLGHHLDAIIAAEVITLRSIFASLRDGMANVGDFFHDMDSTDGLTDELTQARKTTDVKKPTDKPKPKGRGKPKPKPEPEKETQPSTVLPFEQILKNLQDAKDRDEVDEIEAYGRDAYTGIQARNTISAAAADARRRFED